MTRIRFEYWLLISFATGILVASIIPVKIVFFPMIVDYFIAAFMFLAPAIVFWIIFNSACSLMLKREVAGKVIELAVALFAFLVVGCSLFASTILSFLLPASASSRLFSSETFSYVGQIVLTSLFRPVTVALLLGVAIAFGLSYTSSFEKAVNFSKKTYAIQEQAFKLLLRIFPVITMSLGAGLYYTLGTVSVEAYVMSMVLVFLVGLAALAILLMMVGRATHQKPIQLARYSARMFATGLSIGSSYVILPLALRLFKEHFDADSAIRDLVLTLGASLNRCGSVMGVLIVTFVAAHYTGLSISWQQMLLLAFPVALIGFGSPGIQGGTLLVAMPVILYIVPSLNSERFMTVAVALFVGGTTFIQAAVNSVASGYVTLLVNEAASRTKH
jgi:Na+/H+-dicarboxylate symporter